MTNDELWKLYESIIAARERIKAERRARRPGFPRFGGHPRPARRRPGAIASG